MAGACQRKSSVTAHVWYKDKHTHTNEIKNQMAKTVTKKRSVKNEITKGYINSLSRSHKLG